MKKYIAIEAHPFENSPRFYLFQTDIEEGTDDWSQMVEDQFTDNWQTCSIVCLNQDTIDVIKMLNEDIHIDSKFEKILKEDMEPRE